MKILAFEKNKPNIGPRLNSIVDRGRRSWYSFLAFMTTATAATAPTFCANTMEGIMTSILGIIYKIALFSGIAILAYALVSWILAMKDDNAEGQSRAVRNAVVGIALACFETIASPIVNALF